MQLKLLPNDSIFRALSDHLQNFSGSGPQNQFLRNQTIQSATTFLVYSKNRSNSAEVFVMKKNNFQVGIDLSHS